jgi:hypothetical protein
MSCVIQWKPALAFALIVASCSKSESPKNTTTGTGTMHLSGNVFSQSSSGGKASPLPNAEVRATIDRNGDGMISADETYATRSDSKGAYALDVPVSTGDTLVVRFANDGSAPILRTLKGAPKGKMTVNATLKEFESLDCKNATCSLQSGGVAVKGLPQGTRGSARVFNPVTEVDAFPGDFKDSSGNLLVSGVFASFALKDGSGKDLDKLSSPAEVRMRIPRDTWSVVTDITSGNDQIDVPLYSFDEVKGTWVRDANSGHLEDGDGKVVPPSALASIRDGSFAGVIYAVGNVTHFSSWNVDWPIQTHGCVSGRILDETGKPAEGATVSLRGVTYTGTSTPVTVGADGRFCLDAMRSEAPGEDLDGNGKTGEKTTVSIRASANGNVYDLGEFDMPAAQGTCGGAGCLDLGDIKLTSDKMLKAALCTVTGTVKHLDGNAAAGATVFSWDEDVPDDVWNAMCLTGQNLVCTLFATSDQNGSFSLTAPMMAGLTLWGMDNRQLETGVSEFSSGTRTLRSCPKEAVVLTLDQGFISVQLTVTANGNAISWAPSKYGAATVTVSSATDLKWIIYTENGAVMISPITYGTVPAGAKQGYPDQGAPAALASGDQISIWVYGSTSNGTPYYGYGVFTIP